MVIGLVLARISTGAASADRPSAKGMPALHRYRWAACGDQGDGMLYGGTMEPAVLARRIAAGRKRADQKLWFGPAVSLAPTIGTVLDEMGTLVVAMANRAFRGDLFERGIPESLHADIRAMWKRYDYAYHADTTRPLNADIVSPRWRNFWSSILSFGVTSRVGAPSSTCSEVMAVTVLCSFLAKVMRNKRARRSARGCGS